ncbi:putative MFS family arabinose efflux permease [Streptomyces sp. V4I23]|uniref:MFS transporter n=1 Tax=Streptomyces sp. V4I23 TaxID=3042282 RepID=UPI0027869AA2|nr:MFS transporter [Streptomyces sp. V4I23]MDQ1010472.1 putative MFS family arabinose efflux permease [Streptomyces sp. V4I23]
MPQTPRPHEAARPPLPAITPGSPAFVPRSDAGDDATRTAGLEAPARRVRRRRPPGPYGRLFATPGARAFTAGNLIARLPMGMFSVSAVIMIAGSRGSYALAGAVTATGLAATALVAPWTARLVDRYGQARIAVPATVLAVLGELALLLCVRYGAPDWTLFAAYAATATIPNTGGMSRARWAHLHRGDPAALHTANSFEQAADELCFMLGPVLAAFLCAALFPEAGTLTAAILLLVGVLVFAAQRSTEPPPAPRTAAGSPLRAAGMPALLLVFLATGAVFGAMEVVTLAFVDGPAAGAVLALQAAGSCAAGLVYGQVGRAARLVTTLTAMTVLMSLPLLAAAGTGSVLAVAGALLLAGMATAPTMVTGMTVVQRLTPPGQVNEGMTLAVTALLGGIAAGSASGGWVVEHLSPATGYAVPVCAAAVALAVAGMTKARLP